MCRKSLAFWLQKLGLVGAVVVFLVKQPEFPKDVPVTLPLVVAAVPVLAAILDAKMFEYALHSKLISEYIAKHFKDVPLVSNWEKVLWESEAKPLRLNLSRLRSIITLTVTIAPTMLITMLSAVFLDSVREQRCQVFALSGGVVCFLYAALGSYAWSLLFARKSRTAKD